MAKIINSSRNAIRKIVVIFIISIFVIYTTACTNNSGATQTSNINRINKISKSDNILIAYFSLEGNTSNESTNSGIDATTGVSIPVGNTRIIADQIHGDVGGDIFEIHTLDPYPSDYDIVLDQAKKEQESGYKPSLKYKVSSMESYDVVFIGYPIWWNSLPMAVERFLSEYDFSEKTIIPFSTHDGTRFGRSIDDIKKLCPNSTIADGFEVIDEGVEYAKNDVLRWLQNLGVIEEY